MSWGCIPESQSCLCTEYTGCIVTEPLIFSKRTRIDAPAEVVFRWHESPGALDRLIPPWEKITFEQRPGSLHEGERAIIVMRLGPFRKRWVAEHRDYDPPRRFRDVQISGPFAHWDHEHVIEPEGDQACYLEDRIQFLPPLGTIGHMLGSGFTERQLERMFTYRHRVTREDIVQQQMQQAETPLTIAITGSTGLIGSQLVPFLRAAGHTVKRMVRPSSETDEDDVICWDPARGDLDPSQLEGVHVVIHLAGKNIAAGRWTKSMKRELYESRVGSTRLIAERLSKLDAKPSTFICSSGVNYYGSRGDEELTEDSPPGDGFLGETCIEWEKACEPAREAGIRVLNMRTGPVLSPKGGALQKMLTPFRLGIAGVVGDGKQWMSWIALDDMIGAIGHILSTPSLDGPVNMVAPNPVTNREFTKTLGKVLNRPTIFPLPAFAARLALGTDMAEETLLASTRALPRKLLDSGYQFRFDSLEDALRHVLGRQ